LSQPLTFGYIHFSGIRRYVYNYTEDRWTYPTFKQKQYYALSGRQSKVNGALFGWSNVDYAMEIIFNDRSLQPFSDLSIRPVTTLYTVMPLNFLVCIARIGGYIGFLVIIRAVLFNYNWFWFEFALWRRFRALKQDKSEEE
jgi:hypothetical protein